MSAPFAWRCTGCEQFVHHDAVGEHEGGWWHYDALARRWCGITEKVELRCDPS